MAIIGNPIVSTDFPKDTFSGNGSTTAFTMSIAPASVNAVLVIVSGITQAPDTYTISGTTLTFSAAPPTGTDNIIVRHLGIAGIPNTPSAGSVGLTSLSATGTPSSSTYLRGDNSWTSPPSGAVVQVKSTTLTSLFSSTSTSFTDVTGLSVSITPTSTSNKILVFMTLTCGCDLATVFVSFRILRGATAIDVGDAAGSRTQATGGAGRVNDVSDTYSINGVYLDSPATTSSTTYKVQMMNNNGNNAYVGSNGLNANNSATGRYPATITVMEVTP